MVGTSFEELSERRATNLKNLRKALGPVRKLLRGQQYLAGATPGYADYCVFALFMWAPSSSQIELLGVEDSMVAWRYRLLDAYDSFARRSPSAA
jgi:glutathione S-transferase